MATTTRRTRPARTSSGRRRSPGWVPNQHGAWAMLATPLAVGALASGPRWEHLLLTPSGSPATSRSSPPGCG